MKLELKNIKHSEFASHETFCYEANLYVNGKPFAHVSNDGQGGADYLYRDDRFLDGEAWNKCHALLKIHCEKEYARDYGHEWNNPDDGLIGMEYMLKGTIETACHELMTDYLIRKALNKALKEPCYLDGNQIVSYNVSSKRPNIFDQIRRQLEKPDLVFLNELPKDEAFKLFKEVG